MTKAPSKFASSGTTYGRGAGHGGPAKGAGTSTPAHPPFDMGNVVGKLATPELRRLAQDDLEEVLAHYRAVMRNEKEGTLNRTSAAEKLAARRCGNPVARQEHSGPDGAAIPTSLIVGFRKPGV